MRLPVTPRMTLGQVRLHLPSQVKPGQQQQWRRRVATALNRLDLYPGLPPQAILVVRCLPDPQPGGLLAGNGSPERRQWAEAMQRALEGCWRRAARPAYEAVPPSAEAVRFADQAEWLACLSWDIYQGQVTAQWWWHTWLRSNPYRGPADTLFWLWQREARWLPPAIELLYRRYGSSLRPLLAQLKPPQAAAIYRQVAQIYALPDVNYRSASAELLPELPAPARTMARSLPAESRALAVLGLAVTIAPTALQRYRRGERQSRDDESQRPAETQAPAGGRRIDKIVGPEPNPVKAEPTGRPVRPPRKGQLQSKSVKPVPSPQSPVIKPVSAPLRPDKLANPSSSNDDDVIPKARTEAASPLPSAELSSTLHVETAAPERLPVDLSIRTSVGGLWYLVNVLADLDWLPPDDALNGWHKLGGIGQALLAETYEDAVFKGQQVTNCRLNKPPQPPKGGSKSQIPPSGGVGGPHKISKYPICPPLKDAVWGVLAELAKDELPQPVIEQWLSPRLPVIKQYLAARLEQVEDFAEIISEPAALFVTRTHIDVIFSLEQIRVDVRLAGLDRNPGWVPELARIITFHYQ